MSTVIATPLELLEAQVLHLSDADRAHMLERLIWSLDKDPEVEAAWEREIDRREAEIEAGTATWIPVEEVMAELRARYVK